MKEVNNNQWKPVSISRKGPSLSHLFFAGDVLLFSKSITTQVTIIKGNLSYFSCKFDLKVNVNKSRSFLSTATRRSKIGLVISIRGIGHIKSLEKYTGFHMIPLL